MDAAVWGFVGVIIGGLITGYFTNRAEQIRADKEAQLDGAKRRDDRRIERDRFQRETLLALQEAITQLIAVQIEFHVRHEGGPSRSDLPERYRAATAAVIALRSRIADDTIRTSVVDFLAAASAQTGAATADASNEGLDRSGDHARVVFDRSGDLIRATLDEPTVAPVRQDL